MIDIVDYSTIESLNAAMCAKRAKTSQDQYESWQKYHDNLCAVARQFGKVAWTTDNDVDFYFTGDWYHEQTDGFALRTLKGLRPDALLAFQKVVAAHHDNATLHLNGEILTPIDGLEILVTPSIILVAWYEQEAKQCIHRLSMLGIHLK